MSLKNEINRYLGAKFLQAPIYSDTEIRAKLGVSLLELKHLWIFSSRNYFKEAVDNLIHNNVKIDFEKANKTKEEVIK
ncbi:hypothetical protein LNAT_P0302 [Lebetimonas natsushimae]|uniref:Uncharacterized protein n=1 Tax=Lebetimonas natsushimae TaxID=1936991 RepID=A0A292YAC8_9BACT|nr:hypothetical protein [Lebetimonas natsushimae]GAX87007.1 hypothetical protein LNAT_P0302 [Lebetimonas natsushimae]